MKSSLLTITVAMLCVFGYWPLALGLCVVGFLGLWLVSIIGEYIQAFRS